MKRCIFVYSVILLITLTTLSFLVVDKLIICKDHMQNFCFTVLPMVLLGSEFSTIHTFVDLRMKNIRDLTERRMNELRLNDLAKSIRDEINTFASLKESPGFNDLMTKTFLSFAITCQFQKYKCNLDPTEEDDKVLAMKLVDIVFDDLKKQLKDYICTKRNCNISDTNP